MSYINIGKDESNKNGTEYLRLSCFLCKKMFSEIEDSFHLFEARYYKNSETEVPISIILSTILNCEINKTSELHSEIICSDCHEMVIDYELLADQLSDMKNKIINKYNETVEYYDKNLNEFDTAVHLRDEQAKDIKLEEVSNDIEQDSDNTFYVYQYVEKKESNVTDIKAYIFDKKINNSPKYVTEEILEEQSLVDYTSNQEEVYVIAQNNYEPEIEVHCEPNIDRETNVPRENTLTDSPTAILCQNESPVSETKLITNIANCNYKQMYTCTKCGKTFPSKDFLQKHSNYHNKNQSYACEICGGKFISKYTMNAHKKVHTDRERTFKCSQCTKSFFSRNNLLTHQKIHSAVKKYKCDICEKFMSTQHNLDLHKIIHSGIKAFACQICGRSFTRRVELQDHERIHTGEKPFECEICGIAFAQRSNLQSHKRATHFNVKSYKCNECDKSFKRRRLLDYHITSIHTRKRPIKCEMCPADFVYPEHYKKHLQLHYGIKPFECEVCKKKFYTKEYRNAHRFSHSDRKPYECVTCHQGFMRKRTLFIHMKRENHQNDSIIVNNHQIQKDGSLQFQNNQFDIVRIDDSDVEKTIENYGEIEQIEEIEETEQIQENRVTNIFKDKT